MDAREIRGIEIAKTRKITRTADGWLVQSQSGNGFYKVNKHMICNCPDAQFHEASCKHTYAIRYYLQVEKDTPAGTTTQRVRISYGQAWKAYNAAQTSEVRRFDELLSALVEGIDESEQHMGRPRLPLREAVFCSVQKVYSQLSSRRARSLFVNAKERAQITKAPSYNMVNLALNRPELTPILHELIVLSAMPLRSVESSFAVDSSGFRTTRFSDYCNAKHGLVRAHKWVKAHICIGVKTNVVVGVEITGENGADSPQFAPLVGQATDAGFAIKEMTADMAYSSRANYQAVKEAGGQAYIPFKSNATGNARGSKLWHKMYHYFQLNQEEFMAHYHQRSNVETTFHMIKAKFGDKLLSKNEVAQKNELLCKVLAHNIVVLIHEMEALGVKPDFSVINRK